MDKEFIVVDLRNGKTVGEMTMKDFSEWIEDTSQYEEWSWKYIDNNYARKRMLHDLKVCEDYSTIGNRETEWNKFRFIPV